MEFPCIWTCNLLLDAEIQPPFWICPPPQHTHGAARTFLTIIFNFESLSIWSRQKHCRSFQRRSLRVWPSYHTPDRSSNSPWYSDKTNKTNVVRTPPNFRVGGVTLSWGDEQLVRRGSSQRRSDGRQQAHGTAPPVRSASTQYLAYSAPSLFRSQYLRMQTGMPANIHTYIHTYLRTYICTFTYTSLFMFGQFDFFPYFTVFIQIIL